MKGHKEAAVLKGPHRGVQPTGEWAEVAMSAYKLIRLLSCGIMTLRLARRERTPSPKPQQKNRASL